MKKNPFEMSFKEFQEEFPEGTKVKCTIRSIFSSPKLVEDGDVHYEGKKIYIRQDVADGAECINRGDYKYAWYIGGQFGVEQDDLQSIEKISGATKQKMNSRETLLKKIAELEAEKKELKRQMDGFRVTARVRQGDEYYFIDVDGDKDNLTDDRDEFDDYKFYSGNYYKSEEEVEKAIKKQEAFNRIMKYVYDNNLPLTLDWTNPAQQKHQIFYNHDKEALDSDYCKQYQLSVALPYFRSSEDARRVIADCKKDLEIYFL